MGRAGVAIRLLSLATWVIDRVLSGVYGVGMPQMLVRLSESEKAALDGLASAAGSTVSALVRSWIASPPDSTSGRGDIRAGVAGSIRVVPVDAPESRSERNARLTLERIEDVVNALPATVSQVVTSTLRAQLAQAATVAMVPPALAALAAVPHIAEPAPAPAPALGEDDQSRGWA